MSQTLIGNFVTKPAVIAASGSLSGAVDCLGLVLLGVAMPSAWTAAGLSFQGSVDGTTYEDLYDEDGSEISWTGAAASRLLLQSGASPVIGGLTHLKVRSGTAAVPVTQAAARTLTLIFLVPGP